MPAGCVATLSRFPAELIRRTAEASPSGPAPGFHTGDDLGWD
jgi:hypothetical protein